MTSLSPPSPKRASRNAAWMDIIQGGTGLFLALFLWAHMLMVSSILISKDAMYFVARMFEGEPIFGKPYPQLVSAFAIFILTIIVIHAFTALRRFPGSAGQYHTLHRHIGSLRHGDTTLWYVQLITGFMLFFLVSVHLYQLIAHPADIGPYESADRVWSGRMWPLYLGLLLVVEIHGGLGLYRLVIKWGLFLGKNPKKARRRLQTIRWLLIGFFITLGLVTLAAEMKIGYEHRDRAGERYVPSHLRDTAQPGEASSEEVSP